MSKVDYDLTQIKAIAFDVDGVLSPSTIPLGSDGVPMRMVNIKDGFALQLAVKRGYRIAIISGADSPAVTARFRALGIEDIFMKCTMKLEVFRRWIVDNGLRQEHVAFVGDDLPDYEPMEYAGLSVAPSDAAEEIKELATYISPVKGGYGVARDILEEIMKAQDNWATSKNQKAFGW